ncbi:MAG TPA: hypothetical protein VK475_08350 [Pyrinomonadaceae bacterium]|nr:hypothetical protein [Pyrinomonadaceae bacterium]
MELVGEEKRIQALFSEARLADGQSTPGFAGVWNRAQSRSYRPRKAFNLAFVAATALLLCALVSLAWWSTRWQRRPEVIASVPPVNWNHPMSPAPGNIGVDKAVNPPRLVPKRFVSSSKLNAIKLAARREAMLVAANRKSAHDAKAITSWQSPTASLLESSSDGLLKSLPQMNQTVDEMKSFLPSQPK